MLTYRNAKKLLTPEDVAYTTNGKQIIPAKISRIAQEYLDTDVDVLYFEDHRFLWWLTEKVAREAMNYGTT